MRRLGAVVFPNQRRGGSGAISYFQGVIVDLSLEPGMTESFLKDICVKTGLSFSRSQLIQGNQRAFAGCHLSLFQPEGNHCSVAKLDCFSCPLTLTRRTNPGPGLPA